MEYDTAHLKKNHASAITFEQYDDVFKYATVRDCVFTLCIFSIGIGDGLLCCFVIRCIKRLSSF